MIKIIHHYNQLSYPEFLALWLRWISAPFTTMERYIPPKGRYLDIGCGAGLFDILLVTSSPDRHVIGIEPDIHKVKQAKQASTSLERVSFKAGYFSPSSFTSKFDGVIISDVVYLLPPDEKQQLLTAV